MKAAGPEALNCYPRTALAISAGLLVLFGSLSWLAIRRESVTYDETVHSLAAYSAVRLHDYRINVEHPLLWKYWAGLPQLFTDAFHIDTSSEAWKLAPGSRKRQAEVMNDTLFHTPGNDSEELFTRSRFMMLFIGIGLGAMIGWWAFRLAGALAGVTAVFFYALDPNFLGHAPLVTNDVSMSLIFCALMFAVWRVGQAATWRRVLLLALLCGVAVTTKYSALICGPIVVLLLLLRALQPRAWAVFGREVGSRGGRIGRVAAVALLCAGVAYLCIWASYGFRFTISSDPSVHMNLHNDVILEAKFNLVAAHPGVRPTNEQAEAYPVSLFMKTMLALHEHKLLPEPFISGLMYVHANAVIRRTFLLGDVTILGSWLFFPVTMLTKTPVGTMVAILLTLALLAAWRPWQVLRSGLSPRAWDLTCLALPPVVYFAMALKANLNLGMRHIYPVYPFLFIGIGVAAARGVALRPKVAGWVVGALATALLVESAAAFPHYIPFFNAPSGGSRGGLALLGDSNLDWGQGLKQLRVWQEQHPNQRLGLAYFGSAEPEFYGLHAVQLSRPGRNGFVFRLAPDTDVTAISASMLQAILLDPDSQKLMAFVRETQTPFEVVDESIYLYRTSEIFQKLQGALTAQ